MIVGLIFGSVIMTKMTAAISKIFRFKFQIYARLYVLSNLAPAMKQQPWVNASHAAPSTRSMTIIDGAGDSYAPHDNPCRA